MQSVQAARHRARTELLAATHGLMVPHSQTPWLMALVLLWVLREALWGAALQGIITHPVKERAGLAEPPGAASDRQSTLVVPLPQEQTTRLLVRAVAALPGLMGRARLVPLVPHSSRLAVAAVAGRTTGQMLPRLQAVMVKAAQVAVRREVRAVQERSAVAVVVA